MRLGSALKGAHLFKGAGANKLHGALLNSFCNTSVEPLGAGHNHFRNVGQ